jgi:translation elongation factor EF-4
VLFTVITVTAEQRKGKQQQLDTLQVERERGITVKAQTASMLYRNRYSLT